ncbi:MULTISPECIES: YibE/F family protein [unclassified Leucobacter]|uniref:YibE/F family protein n=1 Tax=unclassified Leucobacter TaxID=2621730 RepID=UPI00165DC2B4|nr:MULTISPECIES: YibE/F family protein [unclassified Leucobacter]MBC9927841.1 YibE/F family protein [Leucobacter sp. cx-169]
MSDAESVSISRRWILPVTLSAIVGVILLATVASMLLLWPQSGQVSPAAHSSGAEGTIVTARVSSSEPVACADDGMPQAEVTAPEGGAECTVVRATLPVGETVTFTLDDRQSAQRPPHEGDTVKLVEYAPQSMPDAKPTYAFYDYPRGAPMVFVALAFVAIVIAVGRWRGALSLVGVAIAIALLVTFVLPAILAGKPPVLVASVGSIGIMIVVLYLAHGVSHRTTAALFGSVFGILFTAVAGLWVTRWLRFTGIGSTEDTILMVAIPGLRMSDLLTATIVIAGLGVLNDITVSQASAVWEMRALNPHLSKRRIYASAMRVGRDHIASSIYTLVFAYTGSMLVVLLLLYTYPRDLLELITSEQIAQEVIRTLIGATGLVLAMPVTTAFSVLFSKAPSHIDLEADSPPAALRHGH